MVVVVVGQKENSNNNHNNTANNNNNNSNNNKRSKDGSFLPSCHRTKHAGLTARDLTDCDNNVLAKE